MENKLINGYKHEIFIGLKDQDSYEEILSIEDFKKILFEICEKEDIGFSLLTQVGGYNHNKGYTTENSLRIVIVGASDEEIYKLGEKLKIIINTDTILITKSKLEYAFL